MYDDVPGGGGARPSERFNHEMCGLSALKTCATALHRCRGTFLRAQKTPFGPITMPMSTRIWYHHLIPWWRV